MDLEVAIAQKESKVNLKNLSKFVIFSAFGIAMFLVPVSSGESFNTLIGIISDTIKSVCAPIFPLVVTVFMMIAAGLSVIDYIAKPAWIQNNKTLKKLFSSSIAYVLTKVVAAIVSLLVVLGVGPQMIISGDTGGTMMGLGATLIAITVPLSFILPFLTDSGIMEFLGILLKPLVRVLFKVPGRASIDLITSWFGAANAAIIVSREQYMKGYYTARETATIMTNFSLVSIPFCLVVAGTIGVDHLFPAFYGITCLVGILLALIMPRIAPLTNLPDTYYEPVGKQINEEVPEGLGIFTHAVTQACQRAEAFEPKSVFGSGKDVIGGIVFNLIPTVIAWGTMALIIVEYTAVLDWVSYPMGLYLQVLGVENAFQAAPATLAGFADMFIPALLLTSVESVQTKFIVGALSLVQIIYMTEVGAIIVQSKVPVNVKKLAIIFLERTIIALPIIVLLSKLVF
ncbi:MAG: YjiH family protein [Cellulosilyticaceae bacterium]